MYKDDNHKPEMALALTEFEALCEFVEHEELVEAFAAVPELRECTGPALAEAYVRSRPEERRHALREAFSALMVCSPEVRQWLGQYGGVIFAWQDLHQGCCLVGAQPHVLFVGGRIASA